MYLFTLSLRCVGYGPCSEHGQARFRGRFEKLCHRALREQYLADSTLSASSPACLASAQAAGNRQGAPIEQNNTRSQVKTLSQPSEHRLPGLDATVHKLGQRRKIIYRLPPSRLDNPLPWLLCPGLPPLYF